MRLIPKCSFGDQYNRISSQIEGVNFSHSSNSAGPFHLIGPQFANWKNFFFNPTQLRCKPRVPDPLIHVPKCLGCAGILYVRTSKVRHLILSVIHCSEENPKSYHKSGHPISGSILSLPLDNLNREPYLPRRSDNKWTNDRELRETAFFKSASHWARTDPEFQKSNPELTESKTISRIIVIRSQALLYHAISPMQSMSDHQRSGRQVRFD